MKPSELVGKTITKAEIVGINDYDDEPYLYLTFSDGSEVLITATYGGYTGNSEDEYPAFIKISTANPPQT